MCTWPSFRLLLLTAALAPIAAADASDVKRVGDGFKLSGRVPDMQRYTDCSGHRFLVTLSGLQYVGEAGTTLLEQSVDGSLTLWLALKDVRVTIGRISLAGRPGTAVCGPTLIEMGTRRNLWVAFDFELQSHDDGAALTLKKTRFGLPNDNWSVGTPAWVTADGFGMSRGKVVRGVRDGLAESRVELERQILAIANKVLAEFAALPDSAPAEQAAIDKALAHKLIAEGHLSRDGHIVFNQALPITNLERR
ncbi:MAG: hypothetical protein WD648_10950 [Planctomycetaceae bacterium]